MAIEKMMTPNEVELLGEGPDLEVEVMADADSRSVRDVNIVEIESAGDISHRLLFDPGHGLEERLIQEQFA